MARYIISKKNPYVKLGTHIECFEQECEQVVIQQHGVHAVAKTHKGLVYKKETLRPFMMRILAGGLDKWHDR